MDEAYIQETQERYQRGDFNVSQVQGEDQGYLQGEEKEQGQTITQTISQVNGRKVIITQGINEQQKRILNQNQGDSEEQIDQMCPCCKSDPYNCQNQQCQIMGCCALCCF